MVVISECSFLESALLITYAVVSDFVTDDIQVVDTRSVVVSSNSDDRYITIDSLPTELWRSSPQPNQWAAFSLQTFYSVLAISLYGLGHSGNSCNLIISKSIGLMLLFI